jgi:hypothetical protein
MSDNIMAVLEKEGCRPLLKNARRRDDGDDDGFIDKSAVGILMSNP